MPPRTEASKVDISPTPTGAGRKRLLGEILVQLGYLLPEELTTVLSQQRRQPQNERRALGALCVEMGFLSKDRLDLILDRWGKRLRLGELLVNRGRLTPAQIDQGLAKQRESHGRLGEILVEMGVVDEVALTETLAEQYDLPFVSLDDVQPEPNLVHYVNPHYASRHGAVPLALSGRCLTVAIHDPTGRGTARDLEISTGLSVQIVLATKTDVMKCARRLYDIPAPIPPEGASPQDPGTGDPDAADAFLRNIITRMTSLRLKTQVVEPSATTPSQLRGLLRSLKAAAGLILDETRRAQEGILVTQTDEGDFSRRVVLRAMTQPSAAGEGASLEILDDPCTLTLEHLGLSDPIRTELASVVRGGKGIFLLAGPPGSGMPVVQRALLSVLSRPDSLIYTIEDEILCRKSGVTHLKIDPASGQTAARCLETALRHGPDAIVMDRMDDLECAGLALESGSSSSLIVATIQARDATSAVRKVIELGVSPERLGESILGVLSQRVLRRNCAICTRPYVPRRTILEEWFLTDPPAGPWFHGVGCEGCGGSGFSGRLAAAELWIPDEEERLLLAHDTGPATLRQHVLSRVPCQAEDALGHVLAGRTSLDEALRAVPWEDVVFTRQYGGTRT